MRAWWKCLALVASSSTMIGLARADSSDTQALLSFHRNNYFITGFTESTQVKFQVSVKYDPLAQRRTARQLLRLHRAVSVEPLRSLVAFSREQL